jgi:hypothetical protein
MMVTPVSASPASMARWIGGEARQQGGVDVQAAARRNCQRGGGQDQAVGNDDEDLHLQRAQLGLCPVAEALRRVNREPQRGCTLRNRRGAELAAAAGRAIRLGKDAGDLVPGRVQGVQGGDRELGGPGEGQPHPARFSALASFFSRRSRLIELR